jgi:hypothetical protein
MQKIQVLFAGFEIVYMIDLTKIYDLIEMSAEHFDQDAWDKAFDETDNWLNTFLILMTKSLIFNAIEMEYSDFRIITTLEQGNYFPWYPVHQDVFKVHSFEYKGINGQDFNIKEV